MAKTLSKSLIAERAARIPAAAEDRELAHVVLDAALVPDPRLWDPQDSLYHDAANVAVAARLEYLRIYPRCTDLKSGLRLYVSGIVRWIPYGTGSVKREFSYRCVFCRVEVATLGDDGNRQVPAAWWHKLEAHCLECACRFLLGERKAAKPPWAGWQLARDDPKEPRKKRRKRKRAKPTAKPRQWPGFDMGKIT